MEDVAVFVIFYGIWVIAMLWFNRTTRLSKKYGSLESIVVESFTPISRTVD